MSDPRSRKHRTPGCTESSKPLAIILPVLVLGIVMVALLPSVYAEGRSQTSHGNSGVAGEIKSSKEVLWSLLRETSDTTDAAQQKSCYAFNTSSECRTNFLGTCNWCNGAEKTGAYCCPSADATRCNAYCEATKCSSYQHYDSCMNSLQYAGGRPFGCYWCTSKLVATKGPYCTSKLEYNPACRSCSDFTTIESCRDLLTGEGTRVCAWCSGAHTVGRYCAVFGGAYNPQCPSCQSYRTKRDCTSPTSLGQLNRGCYWCSGAHDTGDYCSASITINPNCPPCSSYPVGDRSSSEVCTHSFHRFAATCGVCWKPTKATNASSPLSYACVARPSFSDRVMTEPNHDCAASCRDLPTSEVCTDNADMYGNTCVWCGPSTGPGSRMRGECFPIRCPVERWALLHTTRKSCEAGYNGEFKWCSGTAESGDYCVTIVDSNAFFAQCGSCTQYSTRESCVGSYNAFGDTCNWCIPEAHNGSYCVGYLDDSNPNCSCANVDERTACLGATSFSGVQCHWCNGDAKSGPFCSESYAVGSFTITINLNCPSCDAYKDLPACSQSFDYSNIDCHWCTNKHKCINLYSNETSCNSMTPVAEITSRATCLGDNPDYDNAWCNATANSGHYCTTASHPNKNCAPCTSHETIASCVASIDTNAWQCSWCNAALHSGPYCTSLTNPNPHCPSCNSYTTADICHSSAYSDCAWCSATATEGSYCFSSSASASSNPNCPTCAAQRSDATCFALASTNGCQWYNPNETTGEYCYDARGKGSAPSDLPSCGHYAQPTSCGAAYAPGTSEHCVWCNATTVGASCVGSSQVASLCQPCSQYATWESCRASADSAGEKDVACQWCNPIVKVGPYCTSKRAPNTQHCGCTVYNERPVCRSAQDPIGQPCSWCVANATSGSFCTSISPDYPRNPTCPACHNATTPMECAGTMQSNGLQCRWCNTTATEGRYCVDTTQVVDRVGLGCTSCPLITTSSTMCGLVGCDWCSRFASTNAQFCTYPDQPNPNCKACDAYATKVECNSHLDPSSETNCTWCGSQVCSSGSCGHCFSLMVPDFVIQPYALSVIGVVKDFLLLVFFSLFWQLTYWRFVAQRRVRACCSSSSSSDDASRSHMYALVFLHDDECIVVDRHEEDDRRKSKPVVSHHDTIVAALTQQHQRAVSKELVWFAIHALRAWEKAVDVSALKKNRSRSDSEMHESHHTMINSSEPFASGSSKEARQEESQHLLESSEDSAARAHNLKSLTKPKHVTAALRKLPLIPAFYVASRRPLARMIASWHNFPGSALMSLYCAAAIMMLTLTTYHVLRVRVARQLSALNCVLLIGYRMINSGASQTLVLVWFQGCKRSNRVRLRVTHAVPRLVVLHTLLFSPFLVLGVAPGFVLYAEIFIPVLTLTFIVYFCGAFLAWRLCFGRWTRKDSSSIPSAVDMKRTSQRDEIDDEGDDDVDDATLANDDESARVFALDDDSENERSEHTSGSISLSTSTAEQPQDTTNQDSGDRFSRLRNFTRDVETRLAEVHNATPSLPPLRRVAVVLLAFLTERALPVLMLSVVMQMAYNYAVLHVYTGVFGYWDVVSGEYNARSAACFIAQVERKTRLTLAELSRGTQTWSSFLPFL